MTTKRVPINRPLRPSVPDVALDLFVQMRACRSDRKWWDLHSQLAKLIPHKPWEWPVIEAPDIGCPPGSRTAQARWLELEALLDERDQAARERHVPTPT